MRITLLASIAAVLALPVLPAMAQQVAVPFESDPEPLAPASFDYGEDDFVFELGVGGALRPEFLGSDDYMASVFAIGSVEYLSIPGLGSFGGPDGLGFTVGPSFNYVGERDAGDLRGLDSVDETYEAGVRVGYEWENAEVYGAVRYAFGGAEGLTGDVGANLIVRPFQRLRLKAGPTANFASSEYVSDYFSVSPDEFARSGGRFDVYDADGGFTSVGLRAEARYEVFTDYFVTAEGSWDHLVGDAGDSPIVDVAGDDDQYYFGLGVSKRFSLDLF